MAPLCPWAGPEHGRCRNSPGEGEGDEGETCPTGQLGYDGGCTVLHRGGKGHMKQRSKHLELLAVQALTGIIGKWSV